MPANNVRIARRIACVLLLSVLGVSPGAVVAAEPWRLDTALALPDWLALSGSARQRYESLGNQFRSGGQGGDQLLALRTLLLAEADLGPVTAGVEFADIRGSFDDDGSPRSSSIVNAADILQAYLRTEFTAAGGETDLLLGRYTLDVGSRHFQQRNGFRNAISALTGINAQWAKDKTELIAFYGLPVERLPGDAESIGQNEVVFDRALGNSQFWGLWGRRDQALGPFSLELFLYGLHEGDHRKDRTRNRQLLTPGLRLRKAPAPGQWDGEAEAAWQTGRARASSSLSDTRDLAVSAQYIHAEAGYSTPGPVTWRLSVEADYVSGDGTPDDGQFGRFDTLFGARRKIFGNTGIAGPLERANILLFGPRVSFQAGRTDGRFFAKPAFLASATDSLARAGLRDPAGQSGRFVGTLLDGRLRRWLLPDQLRGDIGGSVLVNGRFARDAPGATGQGNMLFGYAQLTSYF